MTREAIREDLEPYATILDDFAVITVDHPSENELGCAAFATRSLLAPPPLDPFRDARIERRLSVFGAGPETSEFRERQRGVRPPAGWSATSPTTLLHEGYLYDPVDEGSPEIEKLRTDLGHRFWASPPDVWGTWGRKTLFRRRCRELLGELALPPGVECSATEEDDVVDAVHRLHRRSPGTIVVKLPGTGGEGNRLLRPDSAGEWDARVRQLWAGRQAAADGAVDVVVETWLPWTTTYSVSFMVAPDSAPTPVAACEQILDPTTHGFVGSRSHGPLDAADRQAMLTFLLPLFEAMRRDGYAGVAAIDVVVGPGTSWPQVGLELPSGQRMGVIECNPRFNQHNRIGLVIARLARRWGVRESELTWTARYLRPPHEGTIETLFPTGEPGADAAIPPRPDGRTPVRLLFAHRLDVAVELTIECPEPV